MFAVLSKPNDIAKRIIKGAYPEYRGRTVYVVGDDPDEDGIHRVQVHNYWDEGSRDYAKIVDRFTGRVMLIVPENHPYFCRKIGKDSDGRLTETQNDGIAEFGEDNVLVLHCYRGTRQHIQIILDKSLVPLLGEYKAK
jgi:hypothetical protein